MALIKKSLPKRQGFLCFNRIKMSVRNRISRNKPVSEIWERLLNFINPFFNIFDIRHVNIADCRLVIDVIVPAQIEFVLRDECKTGKMIKNQRGVIDIYSSVAQADFIFLNIPQRRIRADRLRDMDVFKLRGPLFNIPLITVCLFSSFISTVQ